jgi:hypothetical protein
MAALLVFTMASWVGSFAQTDSNDHRRADSAIAQQRPSRHKQAHHCCIPSIEVAVEAILPATPLPCGHEHRCCIRPGPVTPKLPSTPVDQKPATEFVDIVTAHATGPATSLTHTSLRAATLQTYSSFSTVLRN